MTSYLFAGEDDERQAIVWMKQRLLETKKPKDEDQVRMIEDLQSELTGRLAVIAEDGPRQPDEWYDDLWDRFVFALSGTWIDDADDAWESPVTLGEWKFEQAQQLPIGYSKFHVRATVPKGGGSASHAYTQVPPPITWQLMPIAQKDLTFFVGKAKVAEIDAICSVPQLPAEIDAEEAGLRVLDHRRGDKEWQRRVEGRRILSIRNFIREAGNIIANSAILYAPNHDAIKVTKAGRVSVNFTRFLVRERSDWSDHRGGNDLRPMWLIDGQHRTRGLAQSIEGHRLEIPIILFPPTFSLGQSAKIFAEINTLQKKLSPLHTLFMQHRFGIPSPIAKRDFQRPWNPKKSKTWDSRANHLSYECAAFLTASPDGPLRGRIRILDQNKPRLPITQASQWVDFSRAWFLENGIYNHANEQTQDDINAEVENFFRALVNTCNHGGWKDGQPRWSSNTMNKGLLQRQGASQAILKLYPIAWTLAKAESKAAISEKRFMEVLKPLTWVDWTDQRLISAFGGSGERPRSMLRIWMENALLHGKRYPADEVMAEAIKSQPGRGILSPPGDSTLKVKGSKWPTKEGPTTLVASQPVNTLPGSRWTLFDSKGANRTPDNSTVFAKAGTAELVLEHEPWMDDVKWIDVHVDWINTFSPPGKAKLRLDR